MLSINKRYGKGVDKLIGSGIKNETYQRRKKSVSVRRSASVASSGQRVH